MTNRIKPSKTAYLRAMHGQRVIKTVTGIRTVEDIDDMRKELQELVVSKGFPAESLKEDDKKFFIEGTNNFVLKPKLKRVTTGMFYARTKDYQFKEDGKKELSYGDQKGMLYHPDIVKLEVPIEMQYKSGKTGLISYELETQPA